MGWVCVGSFGSLSDISQQKADQRNKGHLRHSTSVISKGNHFYRNVNTFIQFMFIKNVLKAHNLLFKNFVRAQCYINLSEILDFNGFIHN